VNELKESRPEGSSERSADLRGLSAVKRALLEKRLRGVGRAAENTLVPRENPGQPGPLSCAQERLWFLHQLAPNSPLYNILVPIRLTGALEATALRKALEGVVARHEALRTRFISQADEPFQIVDPPREVDLREIDLSREPEPDRAGKYQEIVSAEAHLPFDLSHDPMLRALLVKLAPEEHRLILSIHHIVSDGWSTDVLLRELLLLYRAQITHEPPTLEPLPIQYADFAAWQRTHLSGERMEKERAWWGNEL